MDTDTDLVWTVYRKIKGSEISAFEPIAFFLHPVEAKKFEEFKRAEEPNMDFLLD